ncbi:hypothetical protein [Hymenobacter sp. DG25A]|uniref:hypothetical protein n=1 Tax=Hymenobacter sp. DG25A TaxID=1385663 RepID=UPI000AB7779C|nr:hypothetical protein [Hymenobacter sp. DG25A]
MKHLLLTAMCGGFVLLAAPSVQAQRTDSTRTVKPQLNTAPPAAPTQAPQPQPQPQQQVPVPAPTEQYPQPSQNSPSGLELPPQPKAAEAPQSKYFLYTNFGLGYNSYYGDGQFNASIAPAIGYRVSERFAIGPGLSYSYIQQNYSSFNQQAYGYPKRIVYNNLGLKAFAQLIVYKEFFLHAEYEVTRLKGKATDVNGRVYTQSTTANTPLAGGGYRTRFGNRAAADIVVLYNFNDGIDNAGNRNSPYGQPEIRFNFLFDLK